MAEAEFELLRQGREGRGVEGVVEPGAQVPVGEEVETQHAREVGQGPRGLGEMVQPLEQEHRDKGCPNLDA